MMKIAWAFLWGLLISLLTACSTPKSLAPVIDISSRTRAIPFTPSTATQTAKASFHVVKKGDTLYAIAKKAGVRIQDLLIWNQLDTPRIDIGQVLQLRSPTQALSSLTTNRVKINPVTSSNVQVRQSAKSPTSTSSSPSIPTHAPPPTKSAFNSANTTTWVWPTNGSVVMEFSQNTKGIQIMGKMGQPIVATASGKVVYVGNGIRGYGNLIIVKHTDVLLSAYAHNKTIVVKEGEQVKQGQKIAEMGNSDSATVKLHFEIREQGKPSDPLRFLQKN